MVESSSTDNNNNNGQDEAYQIILSEYETMVELFMTHVLLTTKNESKARELLRKDSILTPQKKQVC
jgi:PHD/YefM family antitoxin component YafN of YafNO toxin-antitoxin module